MHRECAILNADAPATDFRVSRQREYLADAGSAELTRYPEGLASALRKLDADPVSMSSVNPATQHMFIVNPLHDGGESMLSTHPSTEERIRRLMSLMGAYPTAGAVASQSADPLGAAPPPYNQ